MDIRNTARLVLLNESDQLLMFKIEDNTVFDPKQPRRKPFWVTPGGKIESDETPLQTITRELWEETGIKDAQFGNCIWYGEVRLNWKNRATLLKERFYITRVRDQSISFDHLTRDERAAIKEHRWFSLHDLENSNEIFIPKQLPALVKDLLDNGAPKTEISIDLSTPDRI